MKENYLISVTGIQTVDGEKDKIEVTTSGEYIYTDKEIRITYREYDNENPEISFLSTVLVEGNVVTVIRTTPGDSRLILEKGRRHQCHYSTMFGDLTVGVFADRMTCDLDSYGGRLYVSYSLDFNAGLVSHNEIIIDVREKEVI